MEHSVKSEMSNWTKSYTYQLTAEQIQAVEKNERSKFTTTEGGKEKMMDVWNKNPFGGYFGQKYAESYDEAAWFRARCVYLEYKNSELEAQLEKNEECEVCNVSKANEGGCDCQIVTCVGCGEEGHKYNHNLGEDGLLRCDECEEGNVCGDDFRCEDCTHCARTRVCGDCGCVGGCYNDCVNVLA